MSDIEQIKRFSFDRVNEHAREMIENKYQNKHYLFTVSELKDGTLERTITKDKYNDWSAVYAFFDGDKKARYVGKSYGWVWHRLFKHLKDNSVIKPNWKILVLYGKLWICTHEWIEAQLHDKFPQAKHW